MAILRFDSFFQTGALLLTLFCCSGLSADWRPYHARYEIYRNGNLSGQLEVTFEQHGDHWSMSSEGSGIRGMARFLRASENEHAEGSFNLGRFRPISYTYHKRIAGNDDLWTAGFNWHNGTVDISKGKDILNLDTDPDTVDALGLKLEIQRRLRDNDRDIILMQVAEDKIKEMVYRVLEPQKINTHLGCLRAIPVERIHLGSTRYSRSWHAPELDYIMIRLEHGKSNGDDIEIRIAELRFDLQEVKARPGCDAP